MKKIIAILLASFLLVNSAMADCSFEYEKEIARYVEKVERTQRAGRISTAATFSVMSVFWGTMGVILVGPAGVLIGLQFGLIGGAPVGGTFWGVKKLKQKKLNSIMSAYSVVQAANELADSDATSLNKMYRSLKKSVEGLTMDQLKNEVVYLNDTKQLCDGSVKKHPLTFNQLKRELKKRLK
ncbi:MAG: hypothetical protein EP326_14185 [Deltaproteobacteria bacterium]|nr:MAG: hypothetical protein EP326_14185 [Deltaproteobacteria bacterium]TNF26545.1 MAG: hypothetical protein EP319_13615 [Deltaproteobacteria bacterium]